MVRVSGRKHVLLNVHWDRILKVPPTHYLLSNCPPALVMKRVELLLTHPQVQVQEIWSPPGDCPPEGRGSNP